MVCPVLKEALQQAASGSWVTPLKELVLVDANKRVVRVVLHDEPFCFFVCFSRSLVSMGKMMEVPECLEQ